MGSSRKVTGNSLEMEGSLAALSTSELGEHGAWHTAGVQRRSAEFAGE